MLYRANAATVGNAHHNRHLDAALGPVVEFGQLSRDLDVAGEHEAVELNLGNGPVPAQRQADCGSDDARFGQGGVNDALGAELCVQAVGNPEDTAQGTDVFTHEHDFFVLAH